MTPTQNKLQQQMRPFVLKTLASAAPYEMAKAFLRYEKLRSLPLWHRRDLEEMERMAGTSLDDQLDELILAL
jgi:hypothetical protein